MEGKMTEGPAKVDREASWGLGGLTLVEGKMNEGPARADREASWGLKRSSPLEGRTIEGAATWARPADDWLGPRGVDPCVREDDRSVILEVSDIVTISVAGDGHLKSMRSMLTLTRAWVVTTIVSLVNPGTAVWMTDGALRLWMECPVTVAIISFKENT